MKNIFTCVVLLSGTVASAEDAYFNQTCNFTVECVEQESCNATDYDVAIEYGFTPLDDKPTDGVGSGKAIDAAATRRVIVTHSDGAFVANAVDFTSGRTISEEIFSVISTKDGEARLMTALPDVPMVITYHGTCQGDK